MKFKKEVAIIIPTYNESENLPKLLKKIFFIFKKNDIVGRVIVVDDNSPDGTAKIAEKLANKFPIDVILRTENRGYGSSCIAGFRLALKKKFDVIITMDSDFSHDPEVIPLMLKKINLGAQVVIGSRRVGNGRVVGWNLWRHFCSFGASQFSRLVLGLNSKDVTSGFRAYRIEVLKSLDLSKIKSNGYSFLEELLYYIEEKSLKIVEIPITFKDREKGKSKLSKKEIINFFINMLRLKFHLIKIRYNQLIKFLFVGLLGTFVNMFFLWGLTTAGLNLIISSLIAIELSLLGNFTLNNIWTFRSRKKVTFGSKIIKYHLSVLIGIIFNFIILMILTKSFGVFYLVSNLLGILGGTLINYILSSYWAWAEPKK
jgi:dolichol-phosphate mannosyltransferase